MTGSSKEENSISVKEANNQVCFALRRVRKTYGVKRLPRKPFSECRYDWGKYPPTDWRNKCGQVEACSECPWRPALDIGALEIRRGAITAVVGPSGSGKSTLLNLLGLLDRPDLDCGANPIALTVGGQKLNYEGLYGNQRLKDWVRRRRFGFVFQAGHLLSHLSTIKNVCLPLALNGIPRKEREQKAEALLKNTYLDKTRYRSLPRELSGGEYQRVVVMRAISHDPDVVFADEPTGNLDPFSGEAVMRELVRWKEGARDRTLVMVTHKTEEAFSFGDDFVVLSGGRISFMGQKNRDVCNGLDLSRRLQEGARSFREGVIGEDDL